MIGLEKAPFLGAAEYFDSYPDLPESHARIYAKFRPRGVGRGIFFLALLDTGGLYCILNRDIAELVRDDLTSPLDRVAIRTARGLVRGDLYQHTITLIAEVGEPLDIEATVFISPEWNAPSVLGYTGALERFRLSLDPAENCMRFAPPG